MVELLLDKNDAKLVDEVSYIDVQIGSIVLKGIELLPEAYADTLETWKASLHLSGHSRLHERQKSPILIYHDLLSFVKVFRKWISSLEVGVVQIDNTVESSRFV